MPPIIGVTSNYGRAPGYDPPRDQSYLLADYSEAVLAGGGLPYHLPVPREYDLSLLDALLAGVGGLVFSGGLDLHPRHYGEDPHPADRLLHAARDRFEIDLFRRADQLRIPILALCLGFQVAHVARGGRLIQHLDDLSRTPNLTHHLPGDANAFHQVRIEADSRLAQVMGVTETEVTSRHHQIVDAERPGRGLRPVAWSPDGLLEGSEDCDGRFLLAVQWHPEDLTDRREHLRLFEALVCAVDSSPS